MDKIQLENCFKKILDCSFAVHKILGPGLFESVYEECLFYELQEAGLKAERQKSLPVVYKTIRMESGFRIDLLVENSIIVELKSVDSLSDIHLSQILTYMKLSDCNLGLLINFNVKYLKEGIKRVII
jgi:GxxExxY protein